MLPTILRFALTSLALTTTFSLSACSCMVEQSHQSGEANQTTTLSDIAYSAEDKDVNRLLIDGDPYLVLTDDYQGNCLLLSEHVMDEARVYNKPSDTAAYYPESMIDAYLNEEFVDALPESIQAKLVDSNIEVTTKDSLWIGGDETEIVQRKVFLLSFYEVGGLGRWTTLPEGEPLAFFETSESRAATREDGNPSSWWLRTPSTSSGTVVTGVDPDGVPGIGGIYDPNVKDGYKNGIRPAFCIDGRTRVSEIEKGVFAIDEQTGD